MSNGVKFIRVRGRVVPVRSKGEGVDLRSKAGASMADIRAASKEAQKHSRISSSSKLKTAAASGLLGAGVGAFVGGALGAVAGAAASRFLGKKAMHTGLVGGAAIGAGLMAVGSVGAAFSGKQFSNRQFNKALGKRLAAKGGK